MKQRDDDKGKLSDERTINLGTPAPSITETVPRGDDEEDATKKKAILIQSEQAELMLQAFKKKFGTDEWYKKNTSPEMKESTLNLSFKNEEDLTAFFAEQAQGDKEHGVVPRHFIIVDKETQKVLAYSNGDGALYHGNGEKFELGKDKSLLDFSKASDKTLSDFKMPAKGTESDEPVDDLSSKRAP